jgi:hypothetical protein
LAQFSEDVGVGMEIIWDLLIFLVLVAVGLVVLNLVARARWDRLHPLRMVWRLVPHRYHRITVADRRSAADPLAVRAERSVGLRRRRRLEGVPLGLRGRILREGLDMLPVEFSPRRSGCT